MLSKIGEKTMKIFRKEKKSNGRRHILFCGIIEKKTEESLVQLRQQKPSGPAARARIFRWKKRGCDFVSQLHSLHSSFKGIEVWQINAVLTELSDPVFPVCFLLRFFSSLESFCHSSLEGVFLSVSRAFFFSSLADFFSCFRRKKERLLLTSSVRVIRESAQKCFARRKSSSSR